MALLATGVNPIKVLLPGLPADAPSLAAHRTCIRDGQRTPQTCDDEVMGSLSMDEIAARIAAAEEGLAAATGQYERNVFAQILAEYQRYSAERAKQLAKAEAADA